MRLFQDNDGQAVMYVSLVFTIAMLIASDVHGRLAPPLDAHTHTSEQPHAERRAAEVDVVRADARVALGPRETCQMPGTRCARCWRR